MFDLVECRECGEEISSETKICPQCGSSPMSDLEAASVILAHKDYTIKTLAQDLALAEARIRAWAVLALVLAVVAYWST